MCVCFSPFWFKVLIIVNCNGSKANWKRAKQRRASQYKHMMLCSFLQQQQQKRTKSERFDSWCTNKHANHHKITIKEHAWALCMSVVRNTFNIMAIGQPIDHPIYFYLCDNLKDVKKGILVKRSGTPVFWCGSKFLKSGCDLRANW